MTGRIAAGAVLALALAANAIAASFQVNRVETARVGAGYAIAAAPDGTMFVAGLYKTNTTPAVSLAGVFRYGPTGGAAVWTASATGIAGGTTLFEESARAIVIGPGSGTAYDLIVGGALYTGTANQADAWLARYTSSGALVWGILRPGLGSGVDAINAVALAPLGDIIVAGRDSVGTTESKLWIARFNPANGALLSQQSYQAWFGEDAEAFAVTTDAAGEIYVAGFVTIPGSGKDAFVARFDATLSTAVPVWSQAANGVLSSTDYYTGIAVNSGTGALYVAGVTTGAAPFTDILVKQFDTTSGAQVWTRTIDGGEGDHDTASACALTPDGDLVVVGGVDRPTAAFTDIWLARFAPDGSTRWELTRTNQNAYIDEARGVTVDAKGVIRATGYVRGFQTTNADDPRPWIGSVQESSASTTGPTAPGAFALPNPYRPGHGGEFDAAAITIRGLPVNATVRVFRVTGKQVIEMTDTDGDGQVTWDANDGGGIPVATGVYLWVADGGSAGTARGKVVIVR